MERLVDKFEWWFGASASIELVFLTIGYFVLMLFQSILYITDVALMLKNSVIIQIELFTGFVFLMIFSMAIYLVVFLFLNVTDKRCLAAMAILGPAHMFASTIYFGYIIFFDESHGGKTHGFHYTYAFSPVSFIFLLALTSFSAVFMCRKSFFRTSTQVLQDLYRVSERSGKKLV